MANSEPIDIVFDLDGVLLYQVEPSAKVEGHVITAAGMTYLVTPGTVTLLDHLRAIPGVRLSFFSSSSELRNREALDQIKLPDGKSALQIAHRVLSTGDMTAERTKDLTKLNLPGFSLDRAILVDDWSIHGATGQKDNLLLVTPAAGDYDPDISVASNIPEEVMKHRPERDWNLELKRERHKLTRVAAMIDIVLKASELTGTTVKEALNHLQYEPSGEYRYEHTNSDAIFWKGELALAQGRQHGESHSGIRTKVCEKVATLPHAI
jgi:hypothetical protein